MLVFCYSIYIYKNHFVISLVETYILATFHGPWISVQVNGFRGHQEKKCKLVLYVIIRFDLFDYWTNLIREDLITCDLLSFFTSYL